MTVAGQRRSLVVGLRNPGTRFEGTRHNVGGEVVAALAGRHGTQLKRARRFIRADVAELRLAGEPVVFAVPRTFMNNAGQAVAPLVRYFKVDAGDLLVIHDDIDLPFGKLRAHAGRGPGGHNGVRSVSQSLGTREFWRLKLGVGRPPGRRDPATFVLERFTTRERREVDLMVQLAADLAEVFVAEGGEATRQQAGEVGPAS